MAGNVIVPLDGSELAETALPMATSLCRRTGAAVHLVHVRGMTPPATEVTDEDQARGYIDGVAERVAGEGVDVSAAILPDEPPQLLLPTPSPRSIATSVLAYAGQHEADVVMMTTHGRGGVSRRWFGSVADAMLRTSTLPVLLVRSAVGGDSQPVANVLVALAADDAAERSVAAARRIAGVFEPHFTLLRVLLVPFLSADGLARPTVVSPADRAAERESAERDLAGHARSFPSTNIEIAIRVDIEPARGILAFAGEQNVDLIVIGTNSRRGIDRLLLGSVADKVARGADCSVLIVPP